MSLRARVIVLISAVLALSLAAALTLAAAQGRRAVHDELAAALTGGAQTIASAFEDLPRSDHQDRDLRQLVSTFDGNHHVVAHWAGPDGRVIWRSRDDPPGRAAPPWFARLLDPGLPPRSFNLPAGATPKGRLVLTPAPGKDIAAIWSELVGVGLVFVASMAIGLAVTAWAIGRALKPLQDLSRGLTAVGRGDYRPRLAEQGPPEVQRLERGFNAMAADLAAAHARNAALEEQLRTIHDEERAEIARDLHDEVGQHLFAVGVDAQMITPLAAQGDQAAVAAQVGSIQASVTHMQRLVRDILARLRPAEATELGLIPALTDLAAFWRARRPDIALDLDLPTVEPALDPAAREAAYRVAQEAFSNALRHAAPTRIALAAHLDPGALLLVVANDGVTRAGRATGRLGLVGMRERVAARGGDLEITQQGETWIVEARLPLRDRIPEAAG